MARGSGARWRWGGVLAAVAILVSLPAVVAGWPVADSDRSAEDLRTAALSSTAIAFSGYAVSSGGLALPVTDQLSSVADLFSDTITMRVWWRADDDARVDVVTAGGETGVYRDPTGSWRWEYEDNRATRTAAAPLDLPSSPDLLPTSLGWRLLSEAAPTELSRTGAARVAGRDALGIRITPEFEASSVASVDISIDAETGLPLRVRVIGKAAGTAAVDTRFLELEVATPSPAVTAFSPPGGARVRQGDIADVVAEAGRQLSRIDFPATLAGLPRRTVDGAPATIGLYGRGVTLLAVVPLSGRLGSDLQRAADADPNAVRDESGSRFTAGPLGLLLRETSSQTTYLLTGTVTLDALARAAGELPPEGAR